MFEANKHVIAVLKERGALLHEETLKHSYPHCWRHKTPVIFRATAQWFISMEQAGLRKGALREIGKVKWMPAWGESRIGNMIADRPDWGISRQRVWGVPLALFAHRATGEPHPRSAELLDAVAERVEKDGIDAWDALDPVDLLGDEARNYEKVNDILDVWFDSGVSHQCVSKHWPEVTMPADLYLEGSDQHRGWFHSALLTSVALHDRAPYRAVLTHGFTIDDKGRKMSKSLGNVILPQKVIGALGADVLRLWIAATDYANEMSLSDEILKRIAESYRRIRNTVRFLLGNLAGFDPASDQVPAADMVAIDRWALWRTEQLQEEVVAAYRNYQFHLIYQKVHNFCSVDLGGFYLDVLKDRLYTTPAKSHARRSAQTAMFWIAEAMVRWLAPILSFTAEEIWRYMPRAGATNRCSSIRGWRCRRVRLSVRRSTGMRSCACAAASCVSSKSCATRTQSARRSTPRSTCIAPRTCCRFCSRSAKSCGSCSSRPPRACIARTAAQRTRRRRRRATRTSPGSSRVRAQLRNACAAGTSARTLAATRSIRSCAAAVSRTSPGRASSDATSREQHGHQSAFEGMVHADARRQ